jgi:hypothetical protein
MVDSKPEERFAVPYERLIRADIPDPDLEKEKIRFPKI